MNLLSIENAFANPLFYSDKYPLISGATEIGSQVTFASLSAYGGFLGIIPVPCVSVSYTYGVTDWLSVGVSNVMLIGFETHVLLRLIKKYQIIPDISLSADFFTHALTLLNSSGNMVSLSVPISHRYYSLGFFVVPAVTIAKVMFDPHPGFTINTTPSIKSLSAGAEWFFDSRKIGMEISFIEEEPITRVSFIFLGVYGGYTY